MALNGGTASAYANDADGNTLTGGGRVNTWDSQNRLVQSIVNGTASTFKYGADGLRREMTVTPSGGTATTTDYCLDGQSVVREMQRNVQGVLTPTATYLSGPRGPEYKRSDLDGTVRWYVYDGLGSVVGEVDPNGNLTSSTGYDVYGAKRGGLGSASSKHGFVGALGHQTDAETGLVYMRARYYDPSIGRFVSQDPAKNGHNWLEYCDDNPVNEGDSDGKIPFLASGLQAFLQNLGSFAEAIGEVTRFAPIILPLTQLLADVMQGKPLNWAAYAFDIVAGGLSMLGGALCSTLRQEVAKADYDLSTARTLTASINLISIGMQMTLAVMIGSVDP